MANPIIKIKRSAVAGKIPTTTSLELGELAINTYDGKVYIEQDQGAVGVGTTIIIINPWSVGLGSTAYNTYFTAGSVGIGTTNPTEPGLSVLGKVQIYQDSSSNNRIIFRGQPGSSYRWNIDNYSSSNQFRIFREDDATSANGSVAVSISTTGTVTATKFSGDGSLLTGITASGSGVVVQNQGSNVGTAGTLNFSTNLNATFASGTATISLSNNPSISGILTADQVYTSNNGNGTNIRIGDDAWLGDINVANTTRLSGAQDGTKGFIVFGNSDAVALGRTGTGPLYYGGNFEVAGVITASSFNGNASSATYASTAGVATYATNAGVATALQNVRTFEITGDVVASAISFDGTGNVSLAATIQPNSVGLGTDTTGDYVTNITGTSNQITVTSGTGEGSTPTLSIPNQFTAPQDVEITRDLQVNRNLNVNGNITIGGTSATIFSSTLNIYDPDIVLGYRTDAFGNDVSTDNTANHGGIAIASTEGNPLVQLFIAGIETNPATYKKIMWFKAGEFAGLGTDAWLSNYAVGIGSTQFPIGTRLAAGSVQFTQNDLAVVRNVNSSGVSTLGTVQISSGIITATSGVVTYYGDGSKLSNIISGVSISTDTTNQAQLIPYVVSTGSTTGFGVSASGLVFNPSTDNLGINTSTPTQTLHVQGNARITGGIYDSNNNVGTAGSVLSSTGTGLSWIPAAAGGGGAGTTFFGAKFDTNIDSTLYIQPTGTLDIVGVGTTTTQITTFPSGSSEYIIHSIHVTNISNGDAEVTGGFLINSRAVPASISVSIGQSGRAGFNTVTVGSASSIVPGMAVIGTGNIGETTGIGSTAGFQFNTYVTSVDGTVVSFSKPLSGRIVGVATFIPTSKFASRLPIPVGSAVELLKQPMILNALDSIVLQSTGAGTGVGSTSTAAISQTSGSNLLTVTAGAAITNFIAAGQLIQGTGSNTGIQTNTFVGVGYTPGQLTVPMTRPATSTLASQILSFTEVVTPQDGALQATIVYQTTADTSFQGGTGTVVGIVTLASQATSPTLGITSTVPLCYYGTGNTYPSVIQSIRVTNISDGSIYPGGDYPVSVGIGNSDTIFSWLAYNMVIPKNSSIELCEAPKRLGIGQSIFAVASTPYTIEIQIAGRQKLV